MIIVIGAGAQLAQDYINNIGDEPTILISRKKEPQFQVRTNFEWVGSDYTDHEQLIENLRKHELSQIKLIWFSSPFPRELLLKASAEMISSTVSSGVLFPIYVTQFLVGKMILENFGRIVFIGSKLAELGDTGSSLYSTVKGAQLAFSRSLAAEYGRFGITSNVLSLGPTSSGLAENLSENRVLEYIQRTFNKEFIHTQGITNSINFLLENQDVNGMVLNLDAGLR